MTETHAITCPSCGGSLDVKGDEHDVRCPYCGNHIVLSQAATDAPADAPADALADASAVSTLAWVAGVPLIGGLLAPLLVSATTVVLTVIIVAGVMCMVCAIFALTFMRVPRF